MGEWKTAVRFALIGPLLTTAVVARGTFGLGTLSAAFVKRDQDGQRKFDGPRSVGGRI